MTMALHEHFVLIGVYIKYNGLHARILHVHDTVNPLIRHSLLWQIHYNANLTDTIHIPSHKRCHLIRNYARLLYLTLQKTYEFDICYKYPKLMFFEEIKITQTLSNTNISIMLLQRFLYNSKLILKSTFFGNKCVRCNEGQVCFVSYDYRLIILIFFSGSVFNWMFNLVSQCQAVVYDSLRKHAYSNI